MGDLYLGTGNLEAAAKAYQRALDEQASYALAHVGLARVLAARGDLKAAATTLEPVATRLPAPSSVALLGDLYAALGRPQDAVHQYGLVRTPEKLNRANGVAVDLEVARFEADHAREPGGDPAKAVDLARRAFAERPTIYGQDTLAWALRQSGQPAEALPHAQGAVRLGTRDALLWYHLAAVESDLEMSEAAREHLATAFSINPNLTVRDLPAAQELAAQLGSKS